MQDCVRTSVPADETWAVIPACQQWISHEQPESIMHGRACLMKPTTTCTPATQTVSTRMRYRPALYMRERLRSWSMGQNQEANMGRGSVRVVQGPVASCCLTQPDGCVQASLVTESWQHEDLIGAAGRQAPCAVQWADMEGERGRKSHHHSIHQTCPKPDMLPPCIAKFQSRSQERSEELIRGKTAWPAECVRKQKQ